MITLSFFFGEFADDNGHHVVIDSQPIVDDVLGSPNFVATQYTDGRSSATPCSGASSTSLVFGLITPWYGPSPLVGEVRRRELRAAQPSGAGCICP
jgi:hypothetical protein